MGSRPAFGVLGTLLISLCLGIFFWKEILRGETYAFSDQLNWQLPRFAEILSSDHWLRQYEWTPRILFGHSFASEGQPFLFQFPMILLAHLFPLDLAMNINIIFFYLISALFTFFYLRRIGVTRSLSLLGGITFTFSATVTRNFVHMNDVSVFLSLPVCYFLIERALQTPSLSGAFLVGAVLGNDFLSGHPQFVLYKSPVLFLYYVWRSRQLAIRPPLQRSVRWCLVAGFALFLISAVVTFPQLDSVLNLGPQDRVLYSDEATNRINPMTILLSYLAPLSVGSDLPHETTPSVASHSWDWTLYFGVTVFLFLPLSLRGHLVQRKRILKPHRFILILSWCFLMARMHIGGFRIYDLMDWIPVIGKFHNMYRFTFLGTFSAVTMSMIALQHFLKNPRAGYERIRKFLWVPVAVLVFCTLMAMGLSDLVLTKAWTRLETFSGGLFSHHTVLGSRFSILLLMGWMLIWAFQTEYLKRRLFLVGLVALNTGDLLSLGLGAKKTLQLGDVLEPSPLIRYLQENPGRVLNYAQGNSFYDRNLSPKENVHRLTPNMNLFFGIEDAGGFVVPTLTSEEFDFFNELGALVPYQADRWQRFEPKDLQHILPILQLSGVRYLLTEQPIHRSGYSRVDLKDSAVNVYRVEGVLARFHSSDTCQIVETASEAQPNQFHFVVTASSSCEVVSQWRWSKHWKIQMDERPHPTHRTNGIFWAVTIPEGQHHLKAEYVNVPFRIGLLTYLLAFAILIGLFFYSFRKRNLGHDL